MRRVIYKYLKCILGKFLRGDLRFFWYFEVSCGCLYYVVGKGVVVGGLGRLFSYCFFGRLNFRISEYSWFYKMLVVERIVEDGSECFGCFVFVVFIVEFFYSVVCCGFLWRFYFRVGGFVGGLLFLKYILVSVGGSGRFSSVVWFGYSIFF